jgi:hypothetical protein
VPLINATLRQLFEAVEIDYITGHLRFHWKHAEGSTSMMYQWPNGERDDLAYLGKK